MRGFTLIELLVVVLIIGLGVGIVSIGVGNNNHYRLRVEAKQFANQTALLAEEAVLSNQQWGVDLFRDSSEGEERFGYRYLVLNEDGRWQLPADGEFSGGHFFSSGIGVRLQLADAAAEQDIEYKQQITTQPAETDKQAPKKLLKMIDENNKLVKGQEISPEIWMLSNGEMSGFVLTVLDEDNPDQFVEITGDELGRMTLDGGEQEAGERDEQ